VPANLSPDYHRAEERFRAARSAQEKIAALEEMLRVIPKHKGTEGLQGDLKARLAKLRKEPERKGARGGFSHAIPREGAGQVALIGPPNAGKSSLVAALTHARPEVADYPFTTREPVPGMMPFEDIAFQLVDLPPVSSDHVEPWVFDIARGADLLWLVVDGASAPDGLDEVRSLLATRGIVAVPASRDTAPPHGDGSLSYAAVRKRALLVLTGADRPEVADLFVLVDDMLAHEWPLVVVSSVTGLRLDAFKRRTFEAFDIVRIYTKQPGKPADRGAPYALPRGSTVADLATRIHKDLAGHMKFARIWGASAFEGQSVHGEHVLAEGDVVEIHAG